MSDQPTSICDCQPDLHAPLLALHWTCPSCGAQYDLVVRFQLVEIWGQQTRLAYETWERKAVMYT